MDTSFADVLNKLAKVSRIIIATNQYVFWPPTVTEAESHMELWLDRLMEETGRPEIVFMCSLNTNNEATMALAARKLQHCHQYQAKTNKIRAWFTTRY
jgi:hypothetical protein